MNSDHIQLGAFVMVLVLTFSVYHISVWDKICIIFQFVCFSVIDWILYF